MKKYGGYGSGRWGWHRKKTTVQQCISIDSAKWMRQGILRGRIVHSGWQWGFIHYEVNTTDVTRPRVQLTYDRSGQHLDYSVSLETTQPQFGGLRWWFQCPV